MCQDHSGVLIDIPTASLIRPDGSLRPAGRRRAIDACLAPLVQALNQAGFGTVASCCGHGTQLGNIVLTDGRELVIVPDFATSRRIEKCLADRLEEEDR